MKHAVLFAVAVPLLGACVAEPFDTADGVPVSDPQAIHISQYSAQGACAGPVELRNTRNGWPVGARARSSADRARDYRENTPTGERATDYRCAANSTQARKDDDQ